MNPVIRKGVVVTLNGQVLAITLQLGSVFILSRLLSPADFGIIAMCAAVVALPELFVRQGMVNASIQRETMGPEVASGVLFLCLAMACGLTISVWLATPIFLEVFQDDRIVNVLAVLAMGFPLIALGSQHIAFLSRTMRWKTLRGIRLASQFNGVVASVGTAYFLDMGYWSIVCGSLMTIISTTCLAWILFRWMPTTKILWSESWATARVGFAYSLGRLASYVDTWLDKALLGWQTSASDLGQYARASALTSMPQNFIGNSIAQPFFVGLCAVQNDERAWTQLAYQWIGIVSLVNFSVATVACIGAESIVAILLGDQWNDAAAILSVLAISLYFKNFLGFADNVLLSLGFSRRLLVWKLCQLPVTIIALFLGVQSGAIGVAWSITISSALLALPCAFVVTYGTPLTMRNLLKPNLAYGCAFFIVYAVYNFSHDYYSQDSNLFQNVVNLAWLSFCTVLVVVVTTLLSANQRRALSEFFMRQKMDRS
jgi:PST family polysaccharide transporter